jgi:hypothetical protein
MSRAQRVSWKRLLVAPLVKLIELFSSIGSIVKLADYFSGENVRMIVNLSSVDFLALIGILLLMLSTKSVN